MRRGAKIAGFARNKSRVIARCVILCVCVMVSVMVDQVGVGLIVRTVVLVSVAVDT